MSSREKASTPRWSQLFGPSRRDVEIENDTTPVGKAPSLLERKVARGNEFRDKAGRGIAEARALLEHEPEHANSAARAALSAAASALNWLEDTDLEGAAHRELDAYGKWARENVPVGCQLDWSDGAYYRNCPVDLAHTRVGFSIGFVGSRICSLCDQDISECPHIPGYLYRIAGGPASNGHCRICLAEGCAEHNPGETYEAEPIVFITNMHIDEISLVSRPVAPDSRIFRESVDMGDLRDALGAEFEPGERVSCDRCLRDCGGLHDPLAEAQGT